MAVYHTDSINNIISLQPGAPTPELEDVEIENSYAAAAGTLFENYLALALNQIPQFSDNDIKQAQSIIQSESPNLDATLRAKATDAAEKIYKHFESIIQKDSAKVREIGQLNAYVGNPLGDLLLEIGDESHVIESKWQTKPANQADMINWFTLADKSLWGTINKAKILKSGNTSKTQTQNIGLYYNYLLDSGGWTYREPPTSWEQTVTQEKLMGFINSSYNPGGSSVNSLLPYLLQKGQAISRYAGWIRGAHGVDPKSVTSKIVVRADATDVTITSMGELESRLKSKKGRKITMVMNKARTQRAIEFSHNQKILVAFGIIQYRKENVENAPSIGSFTFNMRLNSMLFSPEYEQYLQ